MNKYLLTSYNIPGPIWGSEATAINKVCKISILRQLADKCNTNINKSTGKCQLVVSTVQREQIGCCDEECLNGRFRIIGRKQAFEDHEENILGR